MAAQPNYTEELTAKIIEAYAGGEGDTVEDIAESIGKSVKSVRSKLVREGVYVAAEKPKTTAKLEGPTKKELINKLDSYGVIEVDGLMGATKAGIASVLEFVESVLAIDNEESETETEQSEAA